MVLLTFQDTFFCKNYKFLHDLLYYGGFTFTFYSRAVFVQVLKNEFLSQTINQTHTFIKTFQMSAYLLSMRKVLLLFYLSSLIKYFIFWLPNVILEMLQQTIKHTIQFYVASRVYFCVCKNKIYVIDILHCRTIQIIVKSKLLTSTEIFCINIALLSACQS